MFKETLWADPTRSIPSISYPKISPA